MQEPCIGNAAYNCMNTCLSFPEGQGDQTHGKSQFYLQRSAEGYVVREILVEGWFSLELGSWYSQGCFSLRLTRKLSPCNVQIAKQDLIFGCAHKGRLPLAATESAITSLFASDLDFYSGLFQIILNIIQDFLNEYKQYFCNITSSFSTGKFTGKSPRPLFLLNTDLWNPPHCQNGY